MLINSQSAWMEKQFISRIFKKQNKYIYLLPKQLVPTYVEFSLPFIKCE